MRLTCLHLVILKVISEAVEEFEYGLVIVSSLTADQFKLQCDKYFNDLTDYPSDLGDHKADYSVVLRMEQKSLLVS